MEKFKKTKIKKSYCNCLCCKYCNEYWTEYKPIKNEKNFSFSNKSQIKYRKKYYCEYNCYNCEKYIQKKKKQWELYIMTCQKEELKEKEATGNSNQNLINVSTDKKTEIIQKIKDIKSDEFSKIETRKDGNCMFYSILKSIKGKEILHNELRQIVADYIESINYEEEETTFKEEGCKNKMEYLNKIRKSGEYTNSIALEAITKKN